VSLLADGVFLIFLGIGAIRGKPLSAKQPEEKAFAQMRHVFSFQVKAFL
jgi:hypothetical protein